jgi:hypothetical protein
MEQPMAAWSGRCTVPSHIARVKATTSASAG